MLVTTLNKAIGELYVGGFTILHMTISSKKLLAILKRLQPAVSSSASIPVLENVSFTPGQCAATNLNLTIIAALPECNETFMLPFNVLLNAVSKAAAGDLLINKGVVTDSAGKKWSIAIPADKNFVTLPKFDSEYSQQVDANFFYALSNANKCKAIDDVRSIIYPCIDFIAGCIVATNATILYKEDMAIKGKTQCLVDGSFVKAVSMFQDAEVNVSEKFISVKENGIEVICTLADTKYAAYNSVIPDRTPVNFVCNKKDLIEAVESMNIYGTDLTKIILAFEPGKLSLSFADTKNSSTVTILCEHSVPFDEIALDYVFLLTLLSTLSEDDVTAVFSSFDKAVMIYEGGKTLLLMPYKI